MLQVCTVKTRQIGIQTDPLPQEYYDIIEEEKRREEEEKRRKEEEERLAREGDFGFKNRQMGKGCTALFLLKTHGHMYFENLLARSARACLFGMERYQK